MSIASQYVRGAGKRKVLVPPLSAIGITIVQQEVKSLTPGLIPDEWVVTNQVDTLAITLVYTTEVT